MDYYPSSPFFTVLKNLSFLRKFYLFLSFPLKNLTKTLHCFNWRHFQILLYITFNRTSFNQWKHCIDVNIEFGHLTRVIKRNTVQKLLIKWNVKLHLVTYQNIFVIWVDWCTHPLVLLARWIWYWKEKYYFKSKME